MGRMSTGFFPFLLEQTRKRVFKLGAKANFQQRRGWVSCVRGSFQLSASELFKHRKTCLSTKGQVVLASSLTQSPFTHLCQGLSPTPPSPGAVCFCSLMLITPDCKLERKGSCCVRCQPAREGSGRERSRMRGRKEQGQHCGPGHCCAPIPEGLSCTRSGSGLRNYSLTDR